MAREVKKSTYRKAKSARTTSISQTQWKTGVAGAKGKAGRLYGPKGKRYTGTVKMGDGTTAVYKQGKRVTRRKTAGGGVTPAQAAAARRGSSSGNGSKVTQTTKTASTSRTGFSSSAANRGGYSAKGYQRRLGGKIAGSGSDAVNAETSSGSAKTSSVHDSFIAEPGVRSRSPLGRGRPKQATTNRPVMGQRSRLQKNKSGQLRWVKVVK